MFEREIQSLYARVQKARARGELDTRAYLVATHEIIKLLDELALPILGTNPTDLPEHIVKRFRGYGPGTLMPSSGIRFMVPERIGHTYDPRKVLLQFRTDSKEWGIPSGQVEENDQNELATVRREAREETGITITHSELIARSSEKARCIHTYPTGDQIRGNDNLYRVLAFEGEPSLSKDDEREGLELRYFDINDLPNPFVEMHRYPVELFMEHLRTGKFIMG